MIDEYKRKRVGHYEYANETLYNYLLYKGHGFVRNKDRGILSIDWQCLYGLYAFVCIGYPVRPDDLEAHTRRRLKCIVSRLLKKPFNSYMIKQWKR